MQKLFVKVMEKGKAVEKEVEVIRSWSVADGRHIFLHSNGIYGYKDGKPVKAREEFEIIGDKTQRKAAELWWDNRGGTFSEKFYADLDNEIAKLNEGQFHFSKEDDSNIDATLYRRRPEKDKRKSAFSEPNTWMNWFKERPPWWGDAAVYVTRDGWRYEISDEAVEPSEEEGDE